MIKLKNQIKSPFASKPADAEKIFHMMKDAGDFSLDLKGIDIVSTAFFNKIFFLFNLEMNLNTDGILDIIKIKNASDIHKYAFSAAVDISYNNEK